MTQNNEKFSTRKYSQQIMQKQFDRIAYVSTVSDSEILNTNTNENNGVDYKKLYQQQKKKVLALENLLQLEKIKTKKLASNKIKGKLCPKCLSEANDLKKPFNIQSNLHTTPNTKMKQDMKDFSSKIGQLLKKSNDKNPSSMSLSGYSKKKQFQQITSINFQTHSSKLPMKKYSSDSLNKLKNNSIFPMVENFTVFGVSQANIYNNQSKSVNQLLQGQLLYSLNDPSDVDRQAGRLVFPSGVVLKKLTGQRAKEKAIEMMSFSYTNLKSFILRFKCQQNIDETQYENNQFLCHINPSKSLFCLCIGIYDYTSVGENEINMKKNKQPVSLKQLQQQQSQVLVDEKQINLSTTENPKQQSSQSIPSGQIENCQICISQRVFCISSYYPFFTFYQQILRSLMNIVKMQRLMIYKHNNQKLSETDSKFQLGRMQNLFISSMRDLNFKQVSFNRSYQLKLVNQQKITLLTDWNLAKTYFIQQWIYAIMNMFNVDTFIDVFTLMMLEDRIVFICNNSHILTYTIYLFTNILTKPFNYAFQVISIIPEEEFLGAPFPVVYGMLRKRKQVEQSNIYRDYKNTYVFLNPDKVDIVYTQNKKHLLKCKPQKLKNTLTNIFKDLRKHRATNQKTAKYQIENTDYALTSSIEERQMAVDIVEKVNQYILQQIVGKMPNSYQIKNLKNSIDLGTLPAEKDEHSVLMEKIKVITKKNMKDPFAQKMLDTQMISNIVCK